MEKEIELLSKLQIEKDNIELKKQEIIAKNKSVFEAIRDLENKSNEIEATKEDIREKLVVVMQEEDIKKFENDFLIITYIAPSIRKTFDKEKFVEEMGEEVYNNYTKESSVKAQVRIKAKNES
jgi:regulator of replication initiation timing